MTYEHVANLPFLIDACHLTPEENAERDADPALWAARRYRQPVHIFREAAQRHAKESSKRGQPSPANSSSLAIPSRPATPRLSPQSTAPHLPAGSQDLEILQPKSASTARASSSTTGPASPNASSPSGSYFSTVLSPSPSPDEMEIDSPPTEQQEAHNHRESSKPDNELRGTDPMTGKETENVRR